MPTTAQKKYTADELSALGARPVLGINEAAALIGVSRSSVLRAINRGDLPSSKVGARVLLRTDAVVAWATGGAS